MAIVDSGLARLARRINGSLILPGDQAYQRVRKLFIGRIHEVLPRAIVRCADPRDVVAALAFARGHRLPFAIRSGGHSFAEYSTTDGLLIDLGAMDSVQVRPGTVTTGPGTLLGPLAARLAEYNRLVPCGWCPGVGVAGAVLGGGYGTLSRLYGLGADHLLAAQVVLADGRVVWADEMREPELFWALRGAGGGNFGVVTAMTLMTRPAVPVVTVHCRWPYGHAARVIEEWQRWAPAAEDEINIELGVFASGFPDEPLSVAAFGVMALPADTARRRLAEFVERVGAAPDLLELGELDARAAARHHAYAGDAGDGIEPDPLPAGERPGLRMSKSEFFDRPLPAAAVGELLTGFAEGRGTGIARDLEFVPWRGAIGRVSPDATAFVHREPLFLLKHAVQTGCRATDERRRDARRWLVRSWSTTHPYGSGGVYPNYPDPDLSGWEQAYYGDNLARLRAAKAEYDPASLFRFEQSIPAGVG
ncbi:FAD-binding oxidoreductase [Rhizohabitans arisaemae]|uniref:FAD-binding oxidoreductase n=1 Tax=Rhizohabitans arisaemae TaxID=2720610 RepID=UPI0024B0FE81|nr:FAD-binding oxidoreductase [Rhizohabitans arisaemae]